MKLGLLAKVLIISLVVTLIGVVAVFWSSSRLFADVVILNKISAASPHERDLARKIVVAQLDTANGELLGWFESRDSSGAFVIPDADGSIYLSLSGTATSIGYYGVDPKLPGFLRANLEPRAGLVALKPAPSR